MKVINSGVSREITILKHFRINSGEYIIYKDSSNVCVSLLVRKNGIRLVKPDTEQALILKKIIGILISENFNQEKLKKENCVILNTIFYENQMIDNGFQLIKLSDEQIKRLMKEEEVSIDEQKLREIAVEKDFKYAKTCLKWMFIVIIIFIIAWLLPLLGVLKSCPKDDTTGLGCISIFQIIFVIISVYLYFISLILIPILFMLSILFLIKMAYDSKIRKYSCYSKKRPDEIDIKTTIFKSLK